MVKKNYLTLQQRAGGWMIKNCDMKYKDKPQVKLAGLHINNTTTTHTSVEHWHRQLHYTLVIDLVTNTPRTRHWNPVIKTPRLHIKIFSSASIYNCCINTFIQISSNYKRNLYKHNLHIIVQRLNCGFISWKFFSSKIIVCCLALLPVSVSG